MGQISGVKAQSITYISGVPVASISYVGPISAATLGLGGGENTGLVFSVDTWPEPGQACSDGPNATAKNPQTLYYNQGTNMVYTDAGFESPFMGNGQFYWNQTDSQWWVIFGESNVGETGGC
jgi:hypothetical protein